MSYVDDFREALKVKLPPDAVVPDELADLYLLLCMTRGGAVTAQDVHDAWAIWRSRTEPEHPLLVLFNQLPVGVQRRDDPFVRAIRQAWREAVTR